MTAIIIHRYHNPAIFHQAGTVTNHENRRNMQNWSHQVYIASHHCIDTECPANIITPCKLEV
ncbi:hypothetical protein HanPSC8_Chr02g0075681 [Helianthus annuus]|nr:hypothetical protein HanPSC8_Chr02g0075681 [Helianthus annuus]